LPVFDNLERAVAAAESAQAISSVIEGVKMVLKLFEDTAERMGLTRVKTVGERFDPAMHEAIQQQETEAHAPGTILTEVVPGYMFGQRLLRAAMVVVARKPNKPAAETGANGEAKGGGASA
jgi:molecular chaperone GrpE